MCAKMNIFGIIFIGLLTILAANCEEAHHIDQRILENQGSLYQNKNDFNQTKPITQVVEDVTEAAPLDTYSISSAVSKGHINISSLLRTNDSDSSPINVQINPTEPYIPLSDVYDEAEIPEGNVSQPQPKQVASNAETTIDTEVKDLLDLDRNKNQVSIENHQHPLDSEEPLQIPDKIDKETELIDDGQNTEDQLRRHMDASSSDSYQSPLAVILISVFVALSVLCYAALLAWRRYLENRYGSRTLLVDAEEFADPNDLKHFSI